MCARAARSRFSIAAPPARRERPITAYRTTPTLGNTVYPSPRVLVYHRSTWNTAGSNTPDCQRDRFPRAGPRPHHKNHFRTGLRPAIPDEIHRESERGHSSPDGRDESSRIGWRFGVAGWARRKTTIACGGVLQDVRGKRVDTGRDDHPSSYSVNTTNLLLSQTFNALSSYDLKVRLQDAFTTSSRRVSIGTKQDDGFLQGRQRRGFRQGGRNAGRGGVWLAGKNSREPLGVAQGGTTQPARQAPPKSWRGEEGWRYHDRQSQHLGVSVSALSTFCRRANSNYTNRVVLLRAVGGRGVLSAWRDSTGNNRRMVEVRNAGAEASRDNALVLRDVVNGSYYAFRVFHAGMATPVPWPMAGQAQNNAASARNNIRGQQCLESEHGHRAHGKATVQGGLWLHVHQRQWRRPSTTVQRGSRPCPRSSLPTRQPAPTGRATTARSKVYNKTTSQALIIVGGNFSSSRNVDWIAIGT